MSREPGRSRSGSGRADVLARGLVAVAVAVLLAVASACQPAPMFPLDTQAPLEQSIIGGTQSGSGDYPTVGVILAIGILGQYGVGSMTCTATLIARDVILTAGHCTENPFAGYTDDYLFYFSFTTDVASFGQTTLDLPPQTLPVKASVPHPDWDMNVLNTFTGGLAHFNDIALMVLDGEVSGVAPSMLLESDDGSSLVVDAPVEIVGYGQRDADDQNSFGVKYHATTHINEVGSAEMQIGDIPPGDPQKCHGDSGGPTFLEIDDGKSPSFRLVGVTSHAYDDTDCHRGGVDTRVDAHLAWIKQAMQGACSSGLRTDCAEGGVLSVPVEPPDPDPQPDPSDPADPNDPGTPGGPGDPGGPAAGPGDHAAGGQGGGPQEIVNVGVGNACSAHGASHGGWAALAVLALFSARRRRPRPR